MEILKKTLNQIKEYLPLIILIPTMLGGVWQMINLMNLDLTYIRFFSVSQLVADGLFVLILLPIIWGLPIFLLFVIYKLNKKGFGTKSTFFSTLAMSLIILIYFIIFIYEILEFGGIFKNPSTTETLVLVAIPIIAYYLYNFDYKLLKCKSSNWRTLFTSILFIYSKVTLIISIGIFFLISIRYINSIYMKNRIPENFVNTQIFENKMYEKYNLLVDYYHIAYFNDHYIFVKYHPYKMMPHFIPLNEDYFYGVLVLKIDDFFPTEKFELMKDEL